MTAMTEIEIFQLQEKYRGIRVEDLNETNPSYSCIICSKLTTCTFSAKVTAKIGNAELIRIEGNPAAGKCCPECDPVTEEVFAARYDFH